jgi:hypothetical protein
MEDIMHQKLGILILCPFYLMSQGLFDNAVSDRESESDQGQAKVEINGFIRGSAFVGKEVDASLFETKAMIGEAGLKLRSHKGSWGNAFAEFRFRKGLELGLPVDGLRIREAYVNLYWGNLDLRMGEQIVVWGRADGYNPTNNITPQDMLVRSADDDDRRLSNFMIRSFYYLSPLRIELIWSPVYAASVLPVHLFQLPESVTLTEMQQPDPTFNHGSMAVKLHIELPSADGSISYMRGYMPLPGIDAKAFIDENGQVSVQVMPTPYRMQVLGADFSTTSGSFGIRGELAYRVPEDSRNKPLYIPNSDIQWIIGGDRTWGDFSLIFQYIGKYVFDFQPLIFTGSATDEIQQKNRFISMQTEQIIHGFTLRPALSLFHETMTLEALCLSTWTTDEYYIRPKITWLITDEFSCSMGADLYIGPDQSLFGLIDRTLNSFFTELKVSF